MDDQVISTNVNETQKVTEPTYVPVEKVNAITISPTNPIVTKFRKEMTPIENADNRILVETSADRFVCIRGITKSVEETQTNVRLTDINVVVEVNAIPMVPACPKEGQYFQKMPSLEDTND